MPDQCSLFIGSSTESRDYANALQRVLHLEIETSIWSYGVFLPSHTTLGDLVVRARSSDFAALFLTPDDHTVIRGEYLKTPRDNVIFELGLFIGQLGAERVFLLTPNEEVELPSDLQGVTTIRYRTDRRDEDEFNAVNPAATDIRRAIARLGSRRLPEAPGSLPATSEASGGTTGSSRRAAPEVLEAICRLGRLDLDDQTSICIRSLGPEVEIILRDKTQLRTSVLIDLADAAAAAAVDGLAEAFPADGADG